VSALTRHPSADAAGRPPLRPPHHRQQGTDSDPDQVSEPSCARRRLRSTSSSSSRAEEESVSAHLGRSALLMLSAPSRRRFRALRRRRARAPAPTCPPVNVAIRGISVLEVSVTTTKRSPFRPLRRPPSPSAAPPLPPHLVAAQVRLHIAVAGFSYGVRRAHRGRSAPPSPPCLLLGFPISLLTAPAPSSLSAATPRSRGKCSATSTSMAYWGGYQGRRLARRHPHKCPAHAKISCRLVPVPGTRGLVAAPPPSPQHCPPCGRIA